MKATIFYSDGHGREVLHYNNVKRVVFDKDYDECVVILHDNYTCYMNVHDKTHKPQVYESEDAGKEFVRNHNVSTTPFRHAYTNVFKVEVED